jgi:hypothetical protein
MPTTSHQLVRGKHEQEFDCTRVARVHTSCTARTLRRVPPQCELNPFHQLHFSPMMFFSVLGMEPSTFYILGKYYHGAIPQFSKKILTLFFSAIKINVMSSWQGKMIIF